jgi:uncharacterized membrane protein
VNALYLYLSFVVGGVVLEAIALETYLYFTKKHLRKNYFFYGRYVFLLTFPLLGTLIVINIEGWPLFKIFLSFMAIGPVFEWLVGFFYYHIVGARLWTYHKLSLWGHTSLLAVPLWGMAGILFYLLTQFLM